MMLRKGGGRGRKIDIIGQDNFVCGLAGTGEKNSCAGRRKKCGEQVEVC